MSDRANPERSSLRAMLEARSVALVGASPRPDSLADRCLIELGRSAGRPTVHPVNPHYAGTEIGGRTCVASLDDLAEPVDLVLLAVGDAHLEAELARAARRGDRGAVVFASAVDPEAERGGSSAEFRGRLAAIATEAGMAVCGGGCMGFVNTVAGVRAIGYLERDPLPRGPVALVTHSGSAFSALLRTDRGFGFSLAVSSGQELVTPAAAYIDYALDLTETKVVAVLLETLRAPEELRAALSRAAAADVPVVALTVGASEAGRAMVAAHSGALAGSDGAWEALFDACGVIRVGDLAEMCDTLELFAAGRRAPSRPAGGAGAAAVGGAGSGGVAAVLDSGAERALLVDLASEVGVPFARLAASSLAELGELLDPGLDPGNPLDVWGRGNSTEELFAGSLQALAADAEVDAVVLAVDLVTEYDGDDAYELAVRSTKQATDLPVCVLNHVPAALDRAAAGRLRADGIPVLEGTRSGLLALRHLLDLRDFRRRPVRTAPTTDGARAARWRSRLAGRLDGAAAIELLADYGIASPTTRLVTDRADAVAVARDIGFPVVMKTAAEIAHKTEAGGVVLGVNSADEAAAAYARLLRLGPAVTVSAQVAPGVELALGIVADPLLGPLVVVGAGGVLVELLADRAVGLPPLDDSDALRMLDRLRLRHLLDGVRGAAPCDVDAVTSAICSVAQIALELGDALAALDVNPLSCSAAGVLALDVLVEARPPLLSRR